MLNLFDLVKQELGIDLRSPVGRYRLAGWQRQGVCPILCKVCGLPYAVFRCPYTTSKGNYKYWALVCRGCVSVLSLDDVSESDKKFLRQWDKTFSISPQIKVRKEKFPQKVSDSAAKDNSSSFPLPQKNKPNTFTPTGEQLQVLEAVSRDGDVAIQALAGTGKTTTLCLIAEQVRQKRGHYVAFNRAIVNDASGKFPRNIACITAHGLAYRALGHKYMARLRSPRISPKDLAAIFQVEGFGFRAITDSYYFEPFQMALFAQRTVRNFCKSIEQSLVKESVPKISLVKVNSEVEREFENRVLDIANAMWDDLLKQSGYLKFEHDHYFKMWQLTKPKIPGEILLFDEAQDADPVMLDVVNSQQAQLVYCGDSYQAIYEWRGAIDALELVNVDETRWLTQSFRFGDSIAEIGNDFLKRLDAEKQIVGLKGKNSFVGLVEKPDAILCRTNYGAIISLISSQAQGRKSALMGNVKASLQQFAEGCRELMHGRRTGHPDLAPFANWDEALLWSTDEMASSTAGDIVTLIQLVAKVSVEGILKSLKLAVEEKDAEVLITTAHRAKGKEWKSVRLAGDFQHPDDMDTADLRLTYVAVTRAKERLDVSQLPKSKGDIPPIFSEYAKLPIHQTSNAPKRQRPPIEPNRKSNNSSPSQKKRGILRHLFRS